jgi:hypothetical protein
MIKRWQYPSITEPVSQESENITLDKWYPQFPDFVTEAPPRQYITNGELVLDESQRLENITIDKWFQELSIPILPEFEPYYYPGSVFYTDVALVVTNWFPQNAVGGDWSARNAAGGDWSEQRDA